MGNSQDLLTMSRALTAKSKPSTSVFPFSSWPSAKTDSSFEEPVIGEPEDQSVPAAIPMVLPASGESATPGSLAWWESQYPGSGSVPSLEPFVVSTPGSMDWWNASLQGIGSHR